MAWLDAREATFMLLPDLSFLPGGKIEIGRVLPQTKDKKQPDARRVLSEARLHLSVDDLERDQIYEPWSWNSDDRLKTSAGITADLSLLTGIGAGLNTLHAHNEALDIKCKKLVQKTYLPNVEDFDKLVKDDTVSRLLKKIDRPSVFLITGLMIAHEATVEIVHGKTRGGGAHANADVTSTGVPLNFGINGDVNQAHTRKLIASPREPFILAYQLCRIRRKLLGGFEDGIYTKVALFNDEVAVPGAEALLDFDIEMLEPEPTPQADDETQPNHMKDDDGDS